MLISVTEPQFKEFMRKHESKLTKSPFTGVNIIAETWNDDEGAPRAIKVERNPEAPKNVKIIPAWTIDTYGLK